MEKNVIVPAHIFDNLIRDFEFKDQDMNSLLRKVKKWHWLCIDNYKEYKDIKFMDFARQLFGHVALLRRHSAYGDFCRIYNRFTRYNKTLTTAGAIMLSPEADKVLLVESMHNVYSFPKGKIESEDNGSIVTCAIREVKEETSYDITNKIQASEFLEHVDFRHGTYVSTFLFIIKNVPESTAFKPEFKGEILRYFWCKISSFPFVSHKHKYRIVKPFFNKIAAYL